MTSQEIMKTISSKGWWRNIAPLGSEPNWIEDYPPETIDINEFKLFVYGVDEFLSKQY